MDLANGNTLVGVRDTGSWYVKEDDECKALNANNTNLQDVDGHSMASSSGSSSSDELKG